MSVPLTNINKCPDSTCRANAEEGSQIYPCPKCNQLTYCPYCDRCWQRGLDGEICDYHMSPVKTASPEAARIRIVVAAEGGQEAAAMLRQAHEDLTNTMAHIIPPLHVSLRELAIRQGEWSERVFGTTAERGPIGPLLHLIEEVCTELFGIDEQTWGWIDHHITLGLNMAKLDGRLNYGDLTEHADVCLLWLDAIRRSGFTTNQVLQAAWLKQAQNEAREWPAVDNSQGRDNVKPVNHVRDVIPGHKVVILDSPDGQAFSCSCNTGLLRLSTMDDEQWAAAVKAFEAKHGRCPQGMV
jgi:hypothetical protein